MSGENTDLAVIEEGASVKIGDLFEQLIMQSNHAAHEAEAKLQVEEKGNSVADLQGFCAGIRAFKHCASEAGFTIQPSLFDTANRMTPWVQAISDGDGGESDDTDCSLELDALRAFSATLDELTRSEEYEELDKAMQEEIRKKKDYLYGEAKAGRDLFFVRGWHRGFTWVQGQIKELHFWKGIKEQQAAKKAKEKAEQLPFDDED